MRIRLWNNQFDYRNNRNTNKTRNVTIKNERERMIAMYDGKEIDKCNIRVDICSR